MAKGKIIKGLDGLYEILLENGERISCRARGNFRRAGIKPYIGDTVTVSSEDGGQILSIEERKNHLIRPPLANLDRIFAVIAAASPEPALPTVDKLITIAEFNGIEPCAVITKSDLAPENAARIADIYRRCGFETFIVDNTSRNGVSALSEYLFSLKGLTSAFAGASGVGKSTLMNSLFPDLALATGDLSRKTDRGKHTTRHVELFEYPAEGGTAFIADTPGFGLIDFERFDFYTKEDLPFTFREFVPFFGKCRYTKCTHTKEDGCAVLEAVKNGIIPKERHESYLELYETLKNKHAWD